MNVWTNFLDSNAFFLVASIAILSLVLIFIIILTIGKQNIKKQSVDNTLQEETNALNTLDDDMASIEMPNRKSIQENKIIEEEKNIATYQTPKEREKLEDTHILLGELIIPKEESNKQENLEQSVEMPIIKMKENEFAFNMQPTGDASINENIKIEPPDEYVGEKTEIFDISSISDDSLANQDLTGDVERDVIAAANKFIESVMRS